ncbi:hypothetical protein [Gluconobacter oxydans]|uniref:hypothetical protein n=1 Tax=Gluconobacter oxydans TaxID=442 RepID=UPI0039E81F97
MLYSASPDLAYSMQEFPSSNLMVSYVDNDAALSPSSAGQAAAYALAVALVGASTVHAPQSSSGGLYLTEGEAITSIPLVQSHQDVEFKRQAVSTYEAVSSLRTNDMPIAAIAEMIGVERKTIYSWLNEGVEADPRNFARLQSIAQLFFNERPNTLKYYSRMWKREMSDGSSLHSIICAKDLDVERAKRAIEWLRPAVEKALIRDQVRNRRVSDSPASLLTIDLIAVG